MVLSLKYFLNIYALYERGLLKRKNIFKMDTIDTH